MKHHAASYGAKGLAALALVFLICFVAERRWPLRQWTTPRLPRAFSNLSLGLLGSVAVRLALYSLTVHFAARAAHNHWGILPRLTHGRVAFVAGFFLLDYTLYLWHWMNHQFPFLWRFHNVHHIDLDLDVTTSARFHVGELALASLYRLLQIYVLGVGPATVVVFDAVVWPAVEFHHSNIRLPLGLERALNKVIVTPRMHGIHHSIVRNETNSNFSTIFSFWDRLHATLRLNVPQRELTIGVPSYRRAEEISFVQSLLAPFRAERPWATEDGKEPVRAEPPEPLSTMV
ncbi:MAG: sterol desaturase family protein [Elusimicrobia bacterium]|nr:sterol desaturase family protein [Elusimicrobiota bacterium]